MNQVMIPCATGNSANLTVEVIETLKGKRVLLAITRTVPVGGKRKASMEAIELDGNNLSELVYRLQQIKHGEMRGE